MTGETKRGRAIPDGIKVNVCFQSLRDGLLARPDRAEHEESASPSERSAGQVTAACWEAARIMGAAFASGNLTGWAYFDDGPGQIDGDYLAHLTPDELLAGGDFEMRFDHETGEPVASYAAHWGHSIWIKRSEWTDFQKSVLQFLSSGRMIGANLARAESQCALWLTNKLAENGSHARKRELRSEAIAQIEGLSARAFDRAWSAVAPSFGAHLPGRRNKS